MQPIIVTIAFIVGIMLGVRVNMAITKQSPVQSNIHTVADILASNDRLKDYQILCGRDSAYIYDSSKFIGAAPWGHDGIDSIVLKDNDAVTLEEIRLYE